MRSVIVFALALSLQVAAGISLGPRHDEDGHPHEASHSMDATAPPAWIPPPDPGMHSHSHGSHVAAKVVLDDADLHYWHHYPPSYLAADFRLDNDSAIFGEEFDEAWDPENAGGHRGIMLAHVVAFCLAYFGALPIALALRAADHSAHYIVNAVFLVLAAFGWMTGVAYKRKTPNRYEGSAHGGFGNILVILSIALALLDSVGLIGRAVTFYRGPKKSWAAFKEVIQSGTSAPGNRYEMLGLVDHQEERSVSPKSSGVVFAIGDDEEEEDLPRRSLTDQPPQRPAILTRQYSPHQLSSHGSEHTLHETPPTSATASRKHSMVEERFEAPIYRETTPTSKLRRFGEICLTWVRRAQVVIAYVVVLTGMTTYTGMCRGSFVNSCAAHFIKGSIFFGYGVLTFARYLGAYADLGWAWNQKPGHIKGPSAEMIECCVIFTYGITNTWMERFGAAPGDPYTVKQVQHISIAVMFWFAGLSGILLESLAVKRILAASVSGHRQQRIQPPSYAFSFNPLPALTIAVTGLAMAAHHQDYVFQVEIHSLWGILLAGGSLFRLLTYFFLFLRPPVESSLPSRPPTEVLASFGWAAGGIVFILSDEEIAFAAMRAGYDDMMAFLNITIALTCLVFCWEVVDMTVKGLAVLRMKRGDEEDGMQGDPLEIVE